MNLSKIVTAATTQPVAMKTFHVVRGPMYARATEKTETEIANAARLGSVLKSVAAMPRIMMAFAPTSSVVITGMCLVARWSCRAAVMAVVVPLATLFVDV
eukprot:4973942-Prymnesium_polylepis.1